MTRDPNDEAAATPEEGAAEGEAVATDTGEDEAIAGQEPGAEPGRAPNTLLNALIGAVVSTVLGFIPFSPVLGGAVAAYLEGGESRDGASVGAISGVLTAVPLSVIVLFAAAILIIAPEGGVAVVVAIVLAIVVAVAIYTIGLGALGGILGIYVKNEL